MRTPPITLILLAVLGAWSCKPVIAHAEVHRCSAPDGSLVFTDRRCEDIGAIERVPHDAATPGAGRVYRGGCSRNLRDLVYEVTSAIDSRDVNRLASVYHWVGISTSTAYGVMNRLDAIVQRPLVDIAAIAAAREEPVYADNGMQTDADPTAAPMPMPSVRRAPVGLRIEQTLSNGSTPSRTVFGLRRNLGCWWITL
ncbi:MAG: hypothetical protein ABJA62_03870 [Luteimonas sp.]